MQAGGFSEGGRLPLGGHTELAQAGWPRSDGRGCVRAVFRRHSSAPTRATRATPHLEQRAPLTQRRSQTPRIDTLIVS